MEKDGWVTRTALSLLRYPDYPEERRSWLCPPYLSLLLFRLFSLETPCIYLKGSMSQELKKGKPVCARTWTARPSGEGPSMKVTDVYLYRGVGVTGSISCRGWRCLYFLILPGVLLCQNSTSSGACMYLAAWNVQRSTGSTQNHMTGHLQARSLTNHISSQAEQ